MTAPAMLRVITRLIVFFGVLLWLHPAWAQQNTTTGNSFGYIVGQGPINIFIGNTVGTDTERWYTTHLVQGKSYCLETFRAHSEYNWDLDLRIELRRASDNVVLYTFEGASPGDPSLGYNSRWTRGCLIAPATQEYFVRFSKSGCCTGRVGNFQFRVVETTLHAPRWVVQPRRDALIEIANTTTAAVNIEVTMRDPNGAMLGIKPSKQIPAFGNLSLSVGHDFGLPAAATLGAMQIAHDGPPGAIVANGTSLSATEGLSFETALGMRQGFR